MVSKDTDNFKIALLPGDGIGPEVLEAAISVLKGVESCLRGVRFQFEEFSVGAKEYLSSGDPFPPTILDGLCEFDAIFLGAMGLPDVRWANGIEMTPQLDLRERLDLYCGLGQFISFTLRIPHFVTGHRGASIFSWYARARKVCSLPEKVVST